MATNVVAGMPGIYGSHTRCSEAGSFSANTVYIYVLIAINKIIDIHVMYIGTRYYTIQLSTSKTPVGAILYI